MVSSGIENFLLWAGAGTLTESVIWLLLGIFGLSLNYRRKARFEAFTHYTPTLLTTIGILGTFAGIISGLLSFDVNNIDGSIGLLLAGLKTAFTTSLAGMVLSILYKSLSTFGVFSPKNSDSLTKEQIGPAEMYAVMTKQAEGISALKDSIGGDSENSLVGRMKLFQIDINEQHKATQQSLNPVIEALNQLVTKSQQQQDNFTSFQNELWMKLEEFAEMLSKSATEQVINALKEVISDFNNNLTEQFGENFKRLNEAVLKLVEWQENYRIQLEQMGQQYKEGVSAITQTEASVAHISEESKVIPVVMGDLKTVLESNQHQLNELQKHLEAFSDVRDRAVEAVPEIRKQIDLTLEGVKSAADQMADGVKSSSDSLQTSIENSSLLLADSSEKVHKALTKTSEDVQQSSIETKEILKLTISETDSILKGLISTMKEDSRSMSQAFRDAGQDLVNEADKSRKAFESSLQSMRDNLASSLQQLADHQSQESQRILNGMSKHADEALRDTGEAVQKQVKMLDEAMALELNRVMSEMGRALATITQQFSNDYEKLVAQMNRIVRVGVDA